MKHNNNVEKIYRFLYIEDNEADAELFSTIIHHEWPDCQIICVETENELLTSLYKHPWDLIISDFSLPGFDGYTALAHIRKHFQHTPFIFLSGTIGEEIAVEALKRGADDYVIKDRPARLVPAIRQALTLFDETRQRIQAEEKLRGFRELFEQLAEHSSEVFWFISADPQKVLYVSPAVETVWGCDANEFYTNPQAWEFSISTTDRERVLQSYQACLNSKQARFEEEYRIVQPDGKERWILDRRTPIYHKSGKLVRLSGVATDITERVELEKKFLQSQRLDSIGTLAGGIAHDLNNMLSPILMSATYLRDKMENPNLLHFIEVIESSTRHCASLVRQVLAFSRGTDGKRSEMHPQLVIQDVLELLKETLPRSIRITTDIPRHLGAIHSNPTEFAQVVMNLCVNARDAMPNGGTLSITASEVSVDDATARANPGAKTGDYILLSVKDTGCGIPREIIDRIFDPFYTTKPLNKGTGLGLSTTLGIVKGHGGFLQVSSQPGIGTRFHLFFPRLAQPAESTEQKPESISIESNGELIIVIDDDDAVRDVSRLILQATGYRVLLAENGEKGLELFQQYYNETNLVIVDLMMPTMPGREVIAKIQHLNPQMPIIVVSGLFDAELPTQSQNPTLLHHLQKPMSGDALRITVRQALDSRRTE